MPTMEKIEKRIMPNYFVNFIRLFVLILCTCVLGVVHAAQVSVTVEGNFYTVGSPSGDISDPILRSSFLQGVTSGNSYSVNYTIDTSIAGVADSGGLGSKGFSNAVTSSTVTVGGKVFAANSLNVGEANFYTTGGYDQAEINAGKGILQWNTTFDQGPLMRFIDIADPDLLLNGLLAGNTTDTSKIFTSFMEDSSEFGWSYGVGLTTSYKAVVVDNPIVIDPPPPKTPTLNSPTVQLPHNFGFGITGTNITLDVLSHKFTVDLPIYLQSALTGLGELADTWIAGINKAWSWFDAKDQNGVKYDFDFNAHLVQDKSEATSIINVVNKVGSPNPPCRFNSTLMLQSDCPIPRVSITSPEMEMYGTIEAFCYTDETRTRVSNCKEDGTAPLMLCLNADGSVFTDGTLEIFQCRNITATQNYIAAHEFGHILGLPDEYAPSSPGILCKTLLGLSLFGIPESECLGTGLMEDIKMPTQERYYDYLFQNLSGNTPGFNWTFGLSPDWTNDFPSELGGLVALFESPIQTNLATVPEPGSLLIFVTSGLVLIFVRRRWLKTTVSKLN